MLSLINKLSDYQRIYTQYEKIIDKGFKEKYLKEIS